jgi:hypothetical protein
MAKLHEEYNHAVNELSLRELRVLTAILAANPDIDDALLPKFNTPEGFKTICNCNTYKLWDLLWDIRKWRFKDFYPKLESKIALIESMSPDEAFTGQTLDISTLYPEPSKVSDGHHTFGELYEHRHALFLLLAHKYQRENAYVWTSCISGIFAMLLPAITGAHKPCMPCKTTG